MKLERQKNLFPNQPRIADASAGDVVHTDKYGILIKVEPAKSLLNSRMVKEVLARGDCFVLCPLSGIITVVNGMTLADVVKATLKVEE